MMLVAENITYRYKENKRTILDNVNFTLGEGEFSAVMGESGSGKSTFLAVVAGILRPLSGKVSFNGQDLYSLSDADLSKIHGSSICYVPQSNIMLKNISVLENIISPYSSTEDLKPRALSLLDELGIGNLADNFPYELSGGELKRASLVRAVLMSPSVVIADEPTTGLDKETGNKILSFLSEYAKKGNSVLVATHDEHIESYADNILRLERK